MKNVREIGNSIDEERSSQNETKIEPEHGDDESDHGHNVFELFDNPVTNYLVSKDFKRSCAAICRSKGIYDEAEIEDISGETRKKFLGSESNFKGDATVKTYVGRGVENVIVDFYRKKSAKKRDGIEINLDGITPEVLRAWYGSPQTVFDSLEIEELLDSMSDRDQNILHVWRECEYNNSKTVDEVVRREIKDDFTVYEFKIWRNNLKTKATGYISR